jgi:hypothetical protein
MKFRNFREAFYIHCLEFQNQQIKHTINQNIGKHVYGRHKVVIFLTAMQNICLTLVMKYSSEI